MTLDALFGTTNHTTAAQECARAALIFMYGLLMVRLIGRRVFGNWTPLDIAVAIVTGSTLSRALTGNADLFGTLAATTLLLSLHWVLAQAAGRSRLLSRLFEGVAIPLVRDGRADSGMLRRHAVSAASLEQALREAGLDSPEDARLVMLEPSGRISILRKQ